MYYTYVLRSISYGTRYVGSANDAEKRLIEHNSGKVKYTKGRRPRKIVYREEFVTRSQAVKREIFLKSGQGRKYLDNILNS